MEDKAMWAGLAASLDPPEIRISKPEKASRAANAATVPD